MSVKVGENDNEDGAGTEAYDKDLVSRDEKRQDKALRWFDKHKYEINIATDT